MLEGKEAQGKLIDDKGKQLLKKGDVLNDELLATRSRTSTGRRSPSATRSTRKIREILGTSRRTRRR